MTNPSFTLIGTVGALKHSATAAVFSIRAPGSVPEIVHATHAQVAALASGERVSVIAHIEAHASIGQIWRAESVTRIEHPAAA